MSQELALFIKEGLTRGLSREELKAALQTAKWQDEEIDAAFARYAISDFPIPIPAPKASLSAREAFIYLVLFVTLYLTAFSTGSLWFSFINRWFPDELFTSYYLSDTSGIRQACATLLITAPLFFGLSSRLRKRLAKHPDERQSPVRKWLTYLTLFVAASIIIGTLIGLVQNVLSGELTWRFFLKALTVLVITGIGFGYYLWDLRQDEAPLQNRVQQRLRLFFVGILVLTLGTLVGGLFLSGSPARERVRRIDEQREQTIDRLTYTIDNYYATESRLPTTIEDLWQSRNFSDGDLPALVSRLPEFSYQPTASTSYQICTSFHLPSEPIITGVEVTKPLPMNVRIHNAGLNCFPLDVRRQPR
jgi:hypothetical protein